jgi:hypothetical protein
MMLSKTRDTESSVFFCILGKGWMSNSKLPYSLARRATLLTRQVIIFLTSSGSLDAANVLGA